ncbi:YidC/Oxa1 family membrane protein insertase [Ferrimonas pelagia]|uniref:Membrane insertase YidC/Oxa/ALB C-terminal domain-containing protein n=1 Tax=Ferrimonas pelagia TaxID=1177826 RepID=A0ABP9F5L6_9GAMM
MWHILLDGLIQTMYTLSMALDLNAVGGMLMLTALVRLVLLPLSLRAALDQQANQQRLKALRPHLAQLKREYADDPAGLSKATMGLYRQHGVQLLSRAGMTNMAGQSLFGLGMIQALGRWQLSGGWGWIADLARPDAVLAVLVTLLTGLSLWLMPGSDMPLLLQCAVPLLVGALAWFSFPACVALYWSVSSAFGLLQTLYLRQQRESAQAR